MRAAGRRMGDLLIMMNNGRWNYEYECREEDTRARPRAATGRLRDGAKTMLTHAKKVCRLLHSSSSSLACSFFPSRDRERSGSVNSLGSKTGRRRANRRLSARAECRMYRNVVITYSLRNFPTISYEVAVTRVYSCENSSGFASAKSDRRRRWWWIHADRSSTGALRRGAREGTISHGNGAS